LDKHMRMETSATCLLLVQEAAEILHRWPSGKMCRVSRNCVI